MKTAADELMDEIETFGDRLRALGAALNRYGHHDRDCPDGDVYDETKDCPCGFNWALRAAFHGEKVEIRSTRWAGRGGRSGTVERTGAHED